MKSKDKLLIVFMKNPELGKVKSRIARELGEERALAIYYKLLHNTRQQAEKTDADLAIFYNQYIDSEDDWDRNTLKFKQEGQDLGERMFKALSKGKSMGYKKICLIGVDIWGLTSEIIDKAFGRLDYHDWVFGPAKDGGYYLVGCREPQPEVFELEKWSHSNVLKDTLIICDRLGLSVSLVDELKDIDRVSDLEGTNLN